MNIGDKVMVTNPGSFFLNEVGVVDSRSERDRAGWIVRLDGRDFMYFAEDEIATYEEKDHEITT